MSCCRRRSWSKRAQSAWYRTICTVLRTSIATDAHGLSAVKLRPRRHTTGSVVSGAMTDTCTTSGAVVVHAAAHGRVAATVGGALCRGDDAARATGASTAAAFRDDGALLAVAADPKTLMVLAAGAEGTMRTLLWMYVLSFAASAFLHDVM